MINEIKTFEERKQELLEIGLKNKKVTFEEIADKLKVLNQIVIYLMIYIICLFKMVLK